MMPLGAHQFDEGDHKEVLMKPLFFKCLFFAINVGAILGTTLLVYAQQDAGFRWVFEQEKNLLTSVFF